MQHLCCHHTTMLSHGYVVPTHGLKWYTNGNNVFSNFKIFNSVVQLSLLSKQRAARHKHGGIVSQLFNYVHLSKVSDQSPLPYIYIISDGQKPPPYQGFALHGTSLVPTDHKQWGPLAPTIYHISIKYNAKLLLQKSLPPIQLITDTNSAFLQHQKCKSILQQSTINSMSSLSC
jgi:hypothetical protein